MISEERKMRVESNLINNNKIVEILWETAELKGSDYNVSVRCIKDNVTHIRHVSSLFKGSFECPTCLINDENIKLAKYNFKTINRNLPLRGRTRMLLVECGACGTTKEISRSNLFSQKEIGCDNCRLEKIKTLLSNKGAEFIRREVVKGFSRVFYKGIDGREMSTLETNVVNNICFSVVENHWDSPHFLYAFCSKDDSYPYIKIGTANNPEKRLKDLKLDFNCEIILTIPFESRRVARKYENILHSIFKDKTTCYEITSDFTKGLSKRRKKDNTVIKMGYTEWFSICIKEQLITEVSRVICS